MKLERNTEELLAALDKAIDEATEDDYAAQWDAFLSHKVEDNIFRPARKKIPTTDYVFRNIPINEAIRNDEAMLTSELEGALRALMTKGRFPAVRANYGTAILPSLFGTELFLMPEKTNTLPTAQALGIDALERLLDRGIPSLTAGLGEKVFRMGEIFREILERYPKIKRYVPVYHPDTQGPLDVCEVVLGSEMFYLFYDDPDGIKNLLSLICDTYTAFLKKWYEIFPKTPQKSVHWSNVVFRGNIVLRDDSAMNLSPDAYREFALPYDRLLLDRFDGGVVHFCGRGDHYIEDLAKIPKLFGINLSQPHLNDMEKIYRNTVDRGIAILGFPNFKQEYLARDAGLHGLVSISE